jgi:hypothetical protein
LAWRLSKLDSQTGIMAKLEVQLGFFSVLRRMGRDPLEKVPVLANIFPSLTGWIFPPS